MNTLIRIVISAFAFWVTTLIVGGSGSHGIWVQPYAATAVGDETMAEVTSDRTVASVVTFLLIALVFGVVDGTLGKVVRIVSLPLRIITLGLFGLIINGFLLVVVAWISDLIGFGLRVDGFWWGVLAALVLSILTGILNGLFGTKKRGEAKG